MNIIVICEETFSLWLCKKCSEDLYFMCQMIWKIVQWKRERWKNIWQLKNRFVQNVSFCLIKIIYEKLEQLARCVHLTELSLFVYLNNTVGWKCLSLQSYIMTNFPSIYTSFPLSFPLLPCHHPSSVFFTPGPLYPSFLFSSAAEGCISRCHESFCLIALQTRRQRGRAIVPYIRSCAASLLPLGECWHQAAFMITITPAKHSPATPAAHAACHRRSSVHSVYLCIQVIEGVLY